MWDESLILAGRTFRSRLIVGSGGFPSLDVMRRSHQASGCELVAVTVREVDLARAGESLLDFVDLSRITLLPSTAGSHSAEEAGRTAYLGRESGLGDLVLLEVVGDARTRLPDVQGLLEATKTLVREDFTVLPYTNDDPVVARRLEESGAAAVVALGAPAGSGLGLRNPYGLRLVREAVAVPVILGGGIGTASDAALAMEVGCHGVLVNSAIAGARDPEGMAEAMKLAVEAGRFAHKAGRITRRLHAGAPGPIDEVPYWTT